MKVIELRLATDDKQMLPEKMLEYMDAGVKLGWLINPQEQQVEVYRQGVEVEVRSLSTELSGGNFLPEFKLSISRYL